MLSRLNRHVLSAAFAASMAVGFAASAQAQAGMRVGMLSCDVSGGAGVVVSSRALSCVFNPNDGGPIEHYVGSLDRLGLDIGVTGPGRLVWGVFSPTNAPGPGFLQGSFTGVSGGATIGAGATANYLIGGNNNAFGLQALSVSGQTGLNVTAAFGRVSLQYVPPMAPPRKKHRRHRHR